MFPVRSHVRVIPIVRAAAILCALAVLMSDPVTADKPLGERVLIRRDTLGIPHIFAETDEAAGFGLGYAQAEDHLEVLARRFLEARGEAAKTFGAEALEHDVAMQRVDNYARRAVSSVISARRFAASSKPLPRVSTSTSASIAMRFPRGSRSSPRPTSWPTHTAAQPRASAARRSPERWQPNTRHRSRCASPAKRPHEKTNGPTPKNLMPPVRMRSPCRALVQRRQDHPARQSASLLVVALLGGAHRRSRPAQFLRLDAGRPPLAACRIQRVARIRPDEQRSGPERRLPAAS